MKPLLLYVVNADWFFLSHRLPIALAARNAGFDVHVATTLTGPAEAIERYGFTLHQLTIDRRSAGPLQALRLFLALRKLMQGLQPAVVHLVTIKPVLIGGLAARWARVPLVVAAISGLGFIFTSRGPVALLRRALVYAMYRVALARQGVRVIFQNHDDQIRLQQHAGIRDDQVVQILGSGVDLRKWPPQALPEGVPVVLMAARLLTDKGVLEFVDAARRLQDHKDARFVLVGDLDPGNPTSISRRQLQQWQQEGLIEYWGQRSDMQAVIAAAHMVVLPSYREGLPKVLIEAAASGRAVVTTDVPGCRDAIEPGRSGLLVEVRNSTTLAKAIGLLLDDPVLREAMGVAGRQLAERSFNLSNVIDRHLSIYQEWPFNKSIQRKK